MLRMLRKTFYQTVTLGGRNANFDGLACAAGRGEPLCALRFLG